MQSLLSGFVAHKQELFVWLKQKWAELFNADFEVLLYDEGGGPWRWVRSSAIGSANTTVAAIPEWAAAFADDRFAEHSPAHSGCEPRVRCDCRPKLCA